MRCHRAADRGEIAEQRDARRAVEHDAPDGERDLVLALARRASSSRARAPGRSVTRLPSQLRSSDSSTMRIETGRREMRPMPFSSSAGSE